MKKIETILFDLDGTLINSRQHIINSINFMLEKMNLPQKPAAEITVLIGTSVSDLLLGVLGRDNEQLLPDAHKLFKKKYHQHFIKETALQPHVQETLDYFSAKTKIIITNASRENADFSLQALGIRKHFTEIIGGDDQFCLKPTACQLDRALAGRQKQTALMVGDMIFDILAGKNAGISTCAVTNGIGLLNDLKKAAPDFLLSDLLQLKEFIY